MNRSSTLLLLTAVIPIAFSLSCGLRHIGQSPTTVWHDATAAYGIPSAHEPNDRDKLIVGLAYRSTTQYLLTHHYHYPVAAHWEEALKPYWNKSVPFTVALTGNRRLAMNRNLSGARHGRADITDDTLLFYETTATNRNASGVPPHIPLRQDSGSVPVVITVSGYSINQ